MLFTQRVQLFAFQVVRSNEVQELMHAIDFKVLYCSY